MNNLNLPFSMSGVSALLRQSQRSALRTSSDADLCDLLVQLVHACEAARPVAVRNVLDGPRQGAEDAMVDRTCGFASLYDALRRTRAEIATRNIAPHRLATAAAASWRGNKRPGAKPARRPASPRAGPSNRAPDAG
jgi:hypothetical protein